MLTRRKISRLPLLVPSAACTFSPVKFCSFETSKRMRAAEYLMDEESEGRSTVASHTLCFVKNRVVITTCFPQYCLSVLFWAVLGFVVCTACLVDDCEEYSSSIAWQQRKAAICQKIKGHDFFCFMAVVARHSTTSRSCVYTDCKYVQRCTTSPSKMLSRDVTSC